MCVVAVGIGGLAAASSLFSYAFNVYKLLCVSRPYITINDFLSRNAAERERAIYVLQRF